MASGKLLALGVAGALLTAGVVRADVATGGEAPEDGELARWRSPLAANHLTEGEYLLLRSVSRQSLDLDGDGRREELLVVPFEAPSGTEARSIAVLHRTGTGYRSEFLLNSWADELQSVRLVHFGGSRAPQIVVREQADGSGGFLALHVFGARGGQVRPLLSAPGVYQGQVTLLPKRTAQPRRLALVRQIAGEIDAYPRGFWRENYRWTGDHLVRTSRRQVFYRNVPTMPGERPPILTSPGGGPGVNSARRTKVVRSR